MKVRGQCALWFCYFVGRCVCGSGPLWSWSWSSSSEVLAESGLSIAWTLEHAVYPPCDHWCGSSKTASQYFSSPVATTLPRDSLLLLSITSSDIWFKFTRQSFLLTGSEVCPLCMAVQCVRRTKNVLCLPLPYCLHELHTYLRCEIWCVCSLKAGLCYLNASYVRQSSMYCSLSPLISV